MRGRPWGCVGFACALVVCATACDGGGAPSRGFGSRQLLQTRDPTFGLSGYDEHELLGATTNAAGVPSYVSIDLATGAIEDLGASPPTFQPSVDAGVVGLACALDNSSGTNVLKITDTQSGQVTSIDGIADVPPDCPRDANQVIFVWRTDAGDDLALWAGPYQRLARVATDLVIHQPVSSFGQPALTVLAALATDPTALGLFSIDKATFATAPVLAPVLGAAAFADGAPSGVALASTTLSAAFSVFRMGDHYLYGRTMGDGEVVIFAGPFATGPARELALVTSSPASFVPIVRPFASRGLAFIEDTANASVIRYWDDVRLRLVSCDFPSVISPLAGTATSDGRRLLFGIDPAEDGTGASAPLLLVSLDLAAQAGACSLLVPKDVTSAGFSPDDQEIFWVTFPPGGTFSLWGAQADGTGARTLGSSTYIHDPHFIDGTRLEVALGQDLVWLDLTDSTAQLHYIVEQAFDDVIDLGRAFDAGGNLVVTGYEYNQQDDTGMLGVVDRVTGVKRPISPAVAWYESVPLPALGSTALDMGIAYIVRGRHPSAQDGLWLARLTPGALP